MSEEKNNDTAGTDGQKAADDEPAAAEPEQGTKKSGPEFTAAPDPLASVKKGTADVMASMEGKTVSMKVYVGTIIGVVVLMLLARCGG